MPKLRYTMTLENLHIYGSYKVSKKQMEGELNYIKYLYPSCHVWQRSMRSLVLEWVAHNALYALGIKKARTKDVDLNFPLRWWIEWAYRIAGVLAWPFVK